MRSFLMLALGTLALSLAATAPLATLAWASSAQEPKKASSKDDLGFVPDQVQARPPVGRFRIDNPTPQMARNSMLIDTATGDTWLLCEGGGMTNWCLMSKDHFQAGKP